MKRWRWRGGGSCRCVKCGPGWLPDSDTKTHCKALWFLEIEISIPTIAQIPDKTAKIPDVIKERAKAQGPPWQGRTAGLGLGVLLDHTWTPQTRTATDQRNLFTALIQDGSFSEYSVAMSAKLHITGAGPWSQGNSFYTLTWNIFSQIGYETRYYYESPTTKDFKITPLFTNCSEDKYLLAIDQCKQVSLKIGSDPGVCGCDVCTSGSDLSAFVPREDLMQCELCTSPNRFGNTCNLGKTNSSGTLCTCEQCAIGHAAKTEKREVCEACPQISFCDTAGLPAISNPTTCTCADCELGYRGNSDQSECIECSPQRDIVECAAFGKPSADNRKCSCLRCNTGFRALAADPFAPNCTKCTQKDITGQCHEFGDPSVDNLGCTCQVCSLGFHSHLPDKSHCQECKKTVPFPIENCVEFGFPLSSDPRRCTCDLCDFGNRILANSNSTVCESCVPHFTNQEGEETCATYGFPINSNKDCSCTLCAKGHRPTVSNLDCASCAPHWAPNKCPVEDRGFPVFDPASESWNCVCGRCGEGFRAYSKDNNYDCVACSNTTDILNCEKFGRPHFGENHQCVCESCRVGFRAESIGNTKCVECDWHGLVDNKQKDLCHIKAPPLPGNQACVCHQCIAGFRNQVADGTLPCVKCPKIAQCKEVGLPLENLKTSCTCKLCERGFHAPDLFNFECVRCLIPNCKSYGEAINGNQECVCNDCFDGFYYDHGDQKCHPTWSLEINVHLSSLWITNNTVAQECQDKIASALDQAAVLNPPPVDRKVNGLGFGNVGMKCGTENCFGDGYERAFLGVVKQGNIPEIQYSVENSVQSFLEHSPDWSIEQVTAVLDIHLYNILPSAACPSPNPTTKSIKVTANFIACNFPVGGKINNCVQATQVDPDDRDKGCKCELCDNANGGWKLEDIVFVFLLNFWRNAGDLERILI